VRCELWHPRWWGSPTICVHCISRATAVHDKKKERKKSILESFSWPFLTWLDFVSAVYMYISRSVPSFVSKKKERKKAEVRKAFQACVWIFHTFEMGHVTIINWYCFYCFMRNSLVALLGALFARIHNVTHAYCHIARIHNVTHAYCQIDWGCFYYSIRNSLVALLEALFARIFFRFKKPVCWHFFSPFLCARPLSLTKNISSAPHNRAPVPGCCNSRCVLIMRVCLCVCASVCACDNVYLKWSILTNISIEVACF